MLGQLRLCITVGSMVSSIMLGQLRLCITVGSAGILFHKHMPESQNSVPGYSDKGGLYVVYAHPVPFLGWSEYLWIPGYPDCLPCIRMVKVASVVGMP